MTDLGNEETPGAHVEIERIANTIVERSLALHKQFDQTWDKPSYHNQFHIQATLETIDAVFDAVDTGDPLDVEAQMQAWNETHPDNLITDPALLRQAFRIAFACHDLGNITADEPISNQGEVVFADRYRSKGAEERSKVVAAQFIAEIVGEHPHKALISKLAEHIIEQTKFGQGQFADRPFWTLVQTNDQIGSAYFSKLSNKQLVAGLIQEENGNWNMSLRAMIEFTTNRMKQLFTDDGKRDAIYKLLEQNTHGHTRSDFLVGVDEQGFDRQIRLDDVAFLMKKMSI